MVTEISKAGAGSGQVIDSHLQHSRTSSRSRGGAVLLTAPRTREVCRSDQANSVGEDEDPCLGELVEPSSRQGIVVLLGLHLVLVPKGENRIVELLLGELLMLEGPFHQDPLEAGRTEGVPGFVGFF